MNTINESEPQYLDMMHADISGTSGISFGEAAKGLAGKINKQTFAQASAIVVMTAAHTHSMETGLSDISVSAENIKAFLDFISWSPILVLGFAGFLAGTIAAKSELSDPGLHNWRDQRNAELRAQIERQDEATAVEKVKRALRSGQIDGVTLSKEGKPVNKKGEIVELDNVIQTVLDKMVDADYDKSKLVINDPDKNRKWMKICAVVGAATGMKYAIPAMLVADTLVLGGSSLMPTQTIMGIGPMRIITDIVLATGEIMSTLNIDTSERVRDFMTPTKKKLNTGR